MIGKRLRTIVFSSFVLLGVLAWGFVACVPATPDFACLRCKDRCPSPFVCSADGYCLPEGQDSSYCGASQELPQESSKELTTDQKEQAVSEPGAEPQGEPTSEPSGPEPSDGGPDAPGDAGPDTTPDTPADAAPDTAPDATPDAALDVPSEPVADSTQDAGPDGDAGPEPAPDASPDDAPDGSAEFINDAVSDAFLESPPEPTECQRKDGTPCEVGVGECLSQGVYECVNEVLNCNAQPKASTDEVCDGKDNDCDGKVDNIPNKADPITRPCYMSNSGCSLQNGNYRCDGLCSTGIQTCQSGAWSACAGEIGPKNETCDGKDEDCDGQVDNGLTCVCTPGTTEACYPGNSGCTKQASSYSCNAPCQAGQRTCDTKGAWGACTGAKTPDAEICDGKDNNCDGSIDETFATKGDACSVGVGACKRTGQRICTTDGKGTVCDAKAGSPSTEICDGKDNDCDGSIDEGTLKTFYRDYDGDGFGNPNSTRKACAPPSGYVTNKGDCYDRNVNAKPGQTAYFGTHRGDGSFDYNCDGAQKREPVKCSNCSGNKWKKSGTNCGQNEPIVKCKRISGICTNANNGSKLQKCQ